MKNKFFAAVIAFVFVLIACGGGGGSDDGASSAPGALDTTFGNGGIVITDYLNGTASTYNEINAIAIQNDGKIVVTGYVDMSGSTYEDFIVARYNVDGTLDTTFGTDGFVVTDFNNKSDRATAIALQSDGKIVVAGIKDRGESTKDFALARYNSNGDLDITFGTNGNVTTDVGSDQDDVNAIAIQSNGKIVVVGSTQDSGYAKFAVVKYNVDGTLDTSFNISGIVKTQISSSNSWAYSVLALSDGKIIVSGLGAQSFALVKYKSDGSLDTSFDSDGIVTTAFSGYGAATGYTMALQPDGKIVVAGHALDDNYRYDFALARYNANGSLDASFGANGKVVTDMGGNEDYLNSVKIQADGKIVVGGYSNVNSKPNFIIGRYTSSGALDSSFGNSGKVAISVGDIDNQINSIAIQSDDKIVAGGYNEETITGTSNFALIRLLP